MPTDRQAHAVFNLQRRARRNLSKNATFLPFPIRSQCTEYNYLRIHHNCLRYSVYP